LKDHEMIFDVGDLDLTGNRDKLKWVIQVISFSHNSSYVFNWSVLSCELQSAVPLLLDYGTEQWIWGVVRWCQQRWAYGWHFDSSSCNNLIETSPSDIVWIAFLMCITSSRRLIHFG
jgi:hypothetical protein